MNKDVKYNGFTAVPSDYECQDGELAMSLNLLNEDGAVRNVMPPSAELKILDGYDVLIIHSVPGQKNYILLKGNRDGQFGLSWLQRSEEVKDTSGAIDINLMHDSRYFVKFRSIAIVGNALAVSTSYGVYYLLWKDETYKYLGNRPPFLPISFGAYLQGTLTEGTSTNYTEVPRATYTQYSGVYTGANMPHVAWTAEDDAFWANVSNQALGLLLSEVADKVTSNGYLYQPFFIRYAFKLYDGSYSWHSAPIQMLVMTARPLIGMQCAGGDGGSLTINAKLSVPYFGIAYRIYGELDRLKEWSDIVTGVDVFISAPIYTYNQDKAIKRPISRYKLYEGIYVGGGRRGRTSTSSASSTTTETPKVLIGHYATKIEGPYTDHYITTPWSEMRDNVCALSKNESFNDKIQTESLFYKIATFGLDELQEMNKMERLPLIKADLSNINTLERLEDEYNSHATILAGSLHSYNQRLLMGDISIMPPKAFPMCCMAQAADKTSTEENLMPMGATEVIKVFTRINGKKCVSIYTQPLPQRTDDPNPYPFEECFPRFLYHPDPSAYKMEITATDGKFYSLPLKAHPFLNGVYWFGGLGGEAMEIFEDKDLTTATSSIVANKIYISEINNPFVFPATNIVTIGVGRIYNLSSAAKALSQGQFGQFPLYAFTDEGVWALEVSTTGTISARQPITRDVCINPDGITQIDSAVLFPTDRGIMLISGSQTQCISEAINSEYPFDVLSLPGMDKLHAQLGHEADTCLPTKPFSEFLAQCGMVYDYVHQRIIVFNKNFTYAYIYSLKTQAWGMMFSKIESSINSYPEALAVDVEGNLVDFTQDDLEARAPGLLVTRPLNLDTVNIHKTIDSIIQRGNFAKGNVKSVLYGSRDLINWHLVWSSKDHYLRGFRGTPYKYFRIALLCDLAPGESIYGASVQFTPRLTNQPR